jgi:hypothetical protein
MIKKEEIKADCRYRKYFQHEGILEFVEGKFVLERCPRNFKYLTIYDKWRAVDFPESHRD